jgi:hypothetical protein
MDQKVHGLTQIHILAEIRNRTRIPFPENFAGGPKEGPQAVPGIEIFIPQVREVVPDGGQ